MYDEEKRTHRISEILLANPDAKSYNPDMLGKWKEHLLKLWKETGEDVLEGYQIAEIAYQACERFEYPLNKLCWKWKDIAGNYVDYIDNKNFWKLFQ